MTSRRKHGWIFIIAVIALLVIIFFEPKYGWQMRQWLNPKSTPVAELDPTNPTLAAQNQTLAAQISQLQTIISQVPPNSAAGAAVANGIRADVYLQYPFGFRNEMLVDVGSNQGVAVGKAVLFQGIFIGTISQVFPESATVQTVFDPLFKLPVRVGSSGYDALLVGGADPVATSIVKGSPVAIGDSILTAAPGIPYGLPVGTVSATSTSGDNLFEQGSVGFGYDINSIQAVVVAP
jgi:cell shape-determining protein MreC